MRIVMHTPGLAPLLCTLTVMIRDKLAFVKKRDNAAAREARENAREKNGRRWRRDLAQSMQLHGVSPTEADVSFAQTGTSLKQHVAVVKPEVKSVLTIPIAPETREKTAYELNKSSKPLFRPKETSIFAVANKDGAIKPLFALIKSACQRSAPWFPDAGRVARLGRREALWIIRKERQQWQNT